MKTLLILSIVTLSLLLNAGCSIAQSEPAIEATSTLEAYRLRPPSTSTPVSMRSVNIVPSGPTATPFVHIVQQGETLLGIAIRYGVTLDDLLLVNPGVDPRILIVGQDLSIPGPGGEPIELLMPTPTPVPLQINQVHCYPASGDTVRCLTKIANSLPDPIEGIAVQISLRDSVGDFIAQSHAYTLARWLLEDQTTVLEASFDVDLRSIAFAQAELISAVQVSNLDERVIHVEVSQLHLDQLVDSRLFRFEGFIELLEEGQDGQVFLTVQAFGFGANGEPVGSNALQVLIQTTEFPYSFELPLFSLSGEIEDFNLLIEAQPLFSAE